jgi:outer membrane protein assembly factor BamB
MKSVDAATGRPIVSDLSDPKEVPPNPSCPHLYGGKNQPSGAFSPDTGAMYFPLNNACSAGIGTWSGGQTRKPPVQSLRLADGMAVTGRMVLPPGSDRATSPVGRVEAISASTGKTLWKYEQRAPIYGSLLTTGGNLVFSGDMVRRFRAFNAQNGSILWETILNGPVTARPMTYVVGGRQYLAIGAGGDTQGSAFFALAPELNTTRGSKHTLRLCPAGTRQLERLSLRCGSRSLVPWPWRRVRDPGRVRVPRTRDHGPGTPRNQGRHP